MFVLHVFFDHFDPFPELEKRYLNGYRLPSNDTISVLGFGKEFEIQSEHGLVWSWCTFFFLDVLYIPCKLTLRVNKGKEDVPHRTR